MNVVGSCSLRYSIFNLEDSCKNFITKISKYPKFKSRYNKQNVKQLVLEIIIYVKVIVT